MKFSSLLSLTLLAALTLLPLNAKADGELVSFGDGARVTERTLASGQEMVETVADLSVVSPSTEDEFVSGGLTGPNEGVYVDPSSNV